MATWQVWIGGLLAVQVLMTAVWVGSVLRRDVSLVDRVWGLAFVVAAWTYAVLAAVWTPRTWLTLVLVTVWGLRLSGYITWRNWGEGEDKRYVAMRERRDDFAVSSLWRVFWLQGGLAWVISVPLLAASSRGAPDRLVWLDVLAVVVWLVGFVYEAGGDWQLQRFLADPSNRGKVMDRGLWKHTRHPNYFGDTVVWISYGLLALAVGAWWALIGPALMGYLIVKVSGVALTDEGMASGGSTREGYDEYVRRTNAFVPGPRAD